MFSGRKSKSSRPSERLMAISQMLAALNRTVLAGSRAKWVSFALIFCLRVLTEYCASQSQPAQVGLTQEAQRRNSPAPCWVSLRSTQPTHRTRCNRQKPHCTVQTRQSINDDPGRRGGPWGRVALPGRGFRRRCGGWLLPGVVPGRAVRWGLGGRRLRIGVPGR